MSGLAKHPCRVLGRLVWLTWAISWSAACYFLRGHARSKDGPPQTRARWLQQSCRRTLRVLGTRISTHGQIPHTGLLVCNHLSYLDILVLSALTPAVFVAKREVGGWPVFGWFARVSGTLFANREKRSQVSELNAQIDRVLQTGILVVLFPEGTSSDGKTVLPFKTSLLEPAADTHHTLSAAHIAYHLQDGDVAEEVCYWKDMTLVPHLVNLLSKDHVAVQVHFAEVQRESTERKALARQLQAEVVRLKKLGEREEERESVGCKAE
jgi:lyso-ornithine lipid O-acyltransferase